jgi:hypothetical protein
MASATAALAQPLKLYDNFNAPNILRKKWVGGEGASQLGLDVSRIIESGQLRLRNRSLGFTASDIGTGTNFVFLGLPDRETHDMKATTTATSVNDVGCSGNATPTFSFAGLSGSFFNTRTAINGDATNDVVAALGISSDWDRIAAGKPPRVVSYVLQCTNQRCDTFTVLDFSKLRSISLGLTDEDQPLRRKSDRHRERCRAIAALLWQQDKEQDKEPRTIADMIGKEVDGREIGGKEIKEFGCEGLKYRKHTLRDWIKDLAPNREPGRRPSKNQ